MRPFPLALPLLLALAGCPAPGSTVQQPGPLPVISSGTSSSEPAPSSVRPDDALVAVARAGVDVSALMGPALAAYRPLVEQVRAMRVKHPPTAGYRLMQVEGWTFLGGWWSQATDDKRSLRATFEDADGKITSWDVSRDDNYAPDLHASFPAGLVRAHYEIEQVLPSGGRATFSFVAPLGASGESVEAAGTGSLAVSGAAGSMGIEALSARIGADGAVEQGNLVLRSLGTGSTLQFVGTWDKGGLTGTATLMQSARKAADVYRDAGGRLLLKNESGTYGL